MGQLLVRVCYFIDRFSFIIFVFGGSHSGDGIFPILVRQDVAVHDRDNIPDRFPVDILFLAIPYKKVPMSAQLLLGLYFRLYLGES